MSNDIVATGDVLRCSSCDHERIVSAHWVREVGRRYFPKRIPALLYVSDLQRFKCSSCGHKNLVRGAVTLPIGVESKPSEVKGQQLAVTVISEATPAERETLRHWAQQLLNIRDSDLSVTEKAKAAISATMESKAIMP